MACNSDWKASEKLRNDLEKYVRENIKKCEILDYVKRDYPDYPWSMATLSRRLRYFDIKYINYETPLNAVTDAVSKELNGPGRCLGYRALNQKLRNEHNIKVPRHLVHNVLKELDPEGLESRALNKKTKKPKFPFSSEGPLWLASLDGHDKLCGYQNWTFPLCIYGCLDTFSRKILYLFVSRSNSDPMIVGKKYLEYLTEHRVMPRFLRLDKDTETCKMSTLHAFLVAKRELWRTLWIPLYMVLPRRIKSSAGGVTCTNGLSNILKNIWPIYFKEDTTILTMPTTDSWWHTFSYQSFRESATFLLTTGTRIVFGNKRIFCFQQACPTICFPFQNNMGAHIVEFRSKKSI